MNHQNETLSEAIGLILQHRLGQAVGVIENYLLTHPNQSDMERLNSLKDDYRLMADYWQRGFDDPQRTVVYNQLLRRLYVLVNNVSIRGRLNSSTFLKSIYSRPRQIRKDWSVSAIRTSLEDFVSNIALLDLESEDSREKRLEEAHREHQLLMHDLFDYIVTSRLWKESLANTFEEILLSPTVDSRDQQLIVSAITLSAMQGFDASKFLVLAHVYEHTEDEHLRQRALVGWALCMDGDCQQLFPEVGETVARLCEDERCRRELTELQMQLIYCMEAEEDSALIKDEIMPDLINGSNIKVTRQGLVEMDEDTLEDILHPEAAEQNLERMEQSMKRMADMQKQGSDIYFSGFSQMKRFPFFYDLSNWFVPFYPQHPAIAGIWNQTRGKKFLEIITQVGAFCDSDRYSFVLAFDQVLSRLPQSMLKMVEDGEATPIPVGGEIGIEDQREPAFIRRMYLQNLYRFFRLHPARQEFVSPFTLPDSAVHPPYLLFAHALFQGTKQEAHFCEAAAFLLKRRRYDEVKKILLSCGEEYRDYQWLMLMGNVLMHLPETPSESAADCYRTALSFQPDSRRALAGFARASFREQNFEAALDAYTRLLSQEPDHRNYQLNEAICLTRLLRYDEAQKILFKLNYLYPDDENVSRVLAWTLTVGGKTEQAARLYAQLLAADQPLPDDLLNNGYCLWFSGDIPGAVGMFRRFRDSADDESIDMEHEFMVNEHDVIASHGIGDTEIRLMLDAIYL